MERGSARTSTNKIMKRFLPVILLILPILALAQGFCVDWLPVYLCGDYCHEPIFCDGIDSVFIYSTMADSNPSMTTGEWFQIPTATPRICNAAFPNAGAWVFGWDSVYVRADSAGTFVDSVLWVYNYPPDSGWTSNIEICSGDSSQFFARWLNVTSADDWAFAYDSLWISNTTSHRAEIDYNICIAVDHQVYWSPDSFTSPSGIEIDSLYDPCQSAVCTTFTLLPDDVVDDGFYQICPGVCETLIVPTFYEYDHCLVYDSLRWCFYDSTVAPDTELADTIVFCAEDCGTLWVYYEDVGCGEIIDSFAVVVNCMDYEIRVDGAIYDSTEMFCEGDTLRLCLTGDLCPTFEYDDVCWDLGDSTICSLCVDVQLDSSMWVYLDIDDCWGCGLRDSIRLNTYPRVEVDLLLDGGCAGDSTFFIVEQAGTVGVDSIYVEFDDGAWDGFAVDSLPYVFGHPYGAPGLYTAILTYFSEFDCPLRDSILITQYHIAGSLDAYPNPVCGGGLLTLDASASSSEPLIALSYEFFAPDSTPLCTLSTGAICEDTAYVSGLYYVVITAGGCSDTVFRWVDVIGTEIDSVPDVCAMEGCGKCVELTATAYSCTTGVVFGFRRVYTDSVGPLNILSDSLLCVPPVLDSTVYRAYSWCSGCPDGKDSTDILFAPVNVTTGLRDTIICYGDLVPNILDMDSFAIEPGACDLVVQVLFEYTDSLGPHTEILRDWISPFSLPVYFGYNVYDPGRIIYRFAVYNDTSCVQEESAELRLLHPVANLEISPDTLCEFGTDSILFDASESYYNCTGYGMSFAYFEVDSDSVFTPLYPDYGCCELDADSVMWPMEFPPGENQFAVIVCMADSLTGDILDCCDTAFASIYVWESFAAEIAINPLCSPDTILGGDTISAFIVDSIGFDSVIWGLSCPAFMDSIGEGDSISIFVPDSVDNLIICVQTVSGPCSTCICETLAVVQPITALNCGPAVAIEDSIFEFDISSCIENPSGFGYSMEIVSAPTSEIILIDSILTWNSPSNCEVGIDSVFIEVISESPCAEICTIALEIVVENEHDAITEIDAGFGTACLDSFAFERLDTTLAELVLWGAEGFCTDIGLRLLAEDSSCVCGFRTDETLEWVTIDEFTGSFSADHSHVARGVYFGEIYFSDCNSEDTLQVELNIPHHAPEFIGGFREVLIPNNLDTAIVSIDDFADVDGDPIELDTFSITRAERYERLEEAIGMIIIRASEQYSNYPDAPDTLRITVSDTTGRSVETAILVWVYDPDKIEVQPGKPETTELASIYPNPFNSTAHIEASFAGADFASIEIYDVSGRRVCEIFRGHVFAGNYKFVWNGLSADGVPVSSGIYFVRMTAGESNFVKSISLIK